MRYKPKGPVDWEHFEDMPLWPLRRKSKKVLTSLNQPGNIGDVKLKRKDSAMASPATNKNIIKSKDGNGDLWALLALTHTIISAFGGVYLMHYSQHMKFSFAAFITGLYLLATALALVVYHFFNAHK